MRVRLVRDVTVYGNITGPRTFLKGTAMEAVQLTEHQVKVQDGYLYRGDWVKVEVVRSQK
jgi:hypothetical protein